MDITHVWFVQTTLDHITTELLAWVINVQVGINLELMELAKAFIIHQHNLCQLLKTLMFMEPTHMWEQFIAHLIKSILLIDHLACLAQQILEQWVTKPTAIMMFVMPTPYKPLMEDVQDAL